MDEDIIKSWVLQPDVCRCCLNSSGTWDLTASYVMDPGCEELLSELLQECFGISISYLSDWGPSHMICSLCVGHLRVSCSFRKQVLKAEQSFLKYYQALKGEPSIKSEDDSHQEDIDVFEDIENENNKDLPNCKKSNKLTKNKQKPLKVKRKKRKTTEYDSDEPLKKLSMEYKPENGHITNSDEVSQSFDSSKKNEPNSDDNKTDVNIIGLQQEPVVKQLSERKRVIKTCENVLKETTACPFRHRKSWFQCFFCTNEYMDITTLRNHTTVRHEDIDSELRQMKRYPRSLQIDISDLKCRACLESLPDVAAMRSHLSSVHNKIIYSEFIADYKVNSSPYTCHLCKQEFHVFRTLTTHLNEHYANCICDVCGRSFLNSKRLKVHKRTHESGQFPCSECGKVLKNKTSKANHMESAHSKRVIKCQICFKPMKHYNDRIKHMSEEHNITHMFKCKICSKEYNIKHYLATHMRQTHGNKNKKCQECGMAFITNHGLKKHMSKHTGAKPHKCDVCGKAYARSYTLREHMRAHETDRQFV